MPVHGRQHVLLQVVYSLDWSTGNCIIEHTQS
jgi:hypothetical protein